MQRFIFYPRNFVILVAIAGNWDIVSNNNGLGEFQSRFKLI